VLGVLPEVLSGEDEAYLSFTGATAELTAPDGVAAAPGGVVTGPGRVAAGPGGVAAAPDAVAAGPGGPYLVVDIGGGSTEFVLGDGQPAGQPAARAGLRARSVDIGCVRLTERHLHGDPPSRAEIAAAAADIEAALDTVAAAMPAATARTLVGLAGSVTTVAGLALGLAEYDPGRIHHARIPAAQVAEQTQRLLVQTRAQRAALGVMHPGRVDVIGGGAMVLDHVMRRFGFADVLVSEHDILDGIAWSLAASR
jgi:exopolyphosphatase/guanosine-5'-triphosphate,3'-diphosphate pyrophosphatase